MIQRWMKWLRREREREYVCVCVCVLRDLRYQFHSSNKNRTSDMLFFSTTRQYGGAVGVYGMRQIYLVLVCKANKAHESHGMSEVCLYG